MSSLRFDMPAIRLPDLAPRPDLSVYGQPNRATQGLTQGMSAESALNTSALGNAIKNYGFSQQQAADKANAAAVLSSLTAPGGNAAVAVPDQSAAAGNASSADVLNGVTADGVGAKTAAAPKVTVSPLFDSPNADDTNNSIVDRATTHATNNGISPNLTLAMINAESSGNPDAVSPKGASYGRGLMQVSDGAAHDMGYTPEDMTDPDKNIAAGTGYFAKLHAKYGDSTTALIAYNWGPSRTDAWIADGADPSKLPAKTQAYLRTVISDSDQRDKAQAAANLSTVAVAQAGAGAAQNQRPAAAAVPSAQAAAAPAPQAAAASQPAADDSGVGAPTGPSMLQPVSFQGATPAGQLARARAIALAQAGVGTQAADVAQKGQDAERESVMNALRMYDKNPQIGDAMASQAGVTIPAALRKSAVLRTATLTAHDTLGYQDPQQIGQAAGMLMKGYDPEQVAKVVGPAKAKPVADSFTPVTTYNADGSTNVTPMSSKTGQFMPGQAGIGRTKPPTQSATQTREAAFDQMFPNGTGDPMDRLNFIQGKPIDNRVMLQKVTQSVTAIDQVTGKPVVPPEQQGAEIQRRMQLFAAGRPSVTPAGKGQASDTATDKPGQGSGSQTDPYVASTQAHIDWFKANANKGDVLSVGGKRYTKE